MGVGGRSDGLALSMLFVALGAIGNLRSAVLCARGESRLSTGICLA